MQQLPGSVLSPRSRPPTLVVLVAVVLVLTVVAPIGFIVLRGTTGWLSAGTAPSRVKTTPPATTQAVKTESEEHAAVHLAHLIDKHKKMSESIRRAQDLVRLVAPTLDRNFMQQQRRRLESADFHMESVRREIEESLEELEMMTDLERSK